jgi:PncC family amidohydrolase
LLGVSVEETLETAIGPLLLARGLKVCFAESCTGGLVGHRVTNVPGSSEYYLGSVTAYAYSAKRMLLKVKPETLDAYGAVSRETVIEMAQGVCSTFSGSELSLDEVIGISISGIAGPGGGTPEKPVGTVWIGLSAANGSFAWCFHWPGDRIANKEDSADQALRVLLDYLNGTLPAENY